MKNSNENEYWYSILMDYKEYYLKNILFLMVLEFSEMSLNPYHSNAQKDENVTKSINCSI
jgi:hypothetical protein